MTQFRDNVRSVLAQFLVTARREELARWREAGRTEESFAAAWPDIWRVVHLPRWRDIFGQELTDIPLAQLSAPEAPGAPGAPAESSSAKSA